MHKPQIKRICLALLCVLAQAAAAQEGLKLKSQPTLILIPPTNKDPVPLFVEADKIQGHNDKETDSEGDVRLRKRGLAVFADWLRHDKQDNEITATGNVRIDQRGDVTEGEKLRYNLDTERGFMEKPHYTLTPAAPIAPPVTGMPPFAPTDARGTANRLLFEGPGQYQALQAEYTTCAPGNNDWFIRAGSLEIDKAKDVGVAHDASIVFLGVPIFYSPYLSFSLHQERKSGFLTPSYGSTSTSGTEFTLPYYWNIAPNRDATFSPRLIAKRGAQLSTEFRYLDPRYSGELHVEYLPNDNLARLDRSAFFLKHSQALPYGWSGSLNVNRVSDDKYFADLATLPTITSQVVLPREGALSRGGTWGQGGTYAVSALVQRWQTLQVDPQAPITPPYNRQPQLTLTAYNQNVLRSDFDFTGNFVDFNHPTLVNGKRFMAYPSLSVPLENSFAYVTPKIGVNVAHYMLEKDTTSLPDTTRTVPIFSAESGLVLERSTAAFGQSLTQTLEPKIYYVYIPYRDQSQIPNFESGVQDINFATIYTENQFSGYDRINDANQVTLGLTSRFLNADNGVERLRVGVAQRFYFRPQLVTLPGVPPRPDQTNSSDLLGAISSTIAPHWTTDGGVRYNTDLAQVQQLNVGTRYQPHPGKTLNLSYRYTVDSLKQTDISTQWPLSSQWSVYGRWNYSVPDKLTIEALGGIEYNGGCWVFSAVAHRFQTTAQQTTTGIFLQLELNGVSRIGSNPNDALSRNIAGYYRADRQTSRAEDYYRPFR
jgi:LPS-assembly protein